MYFLGPQDNRRSPANSGCSTVKNHVTLQTMDTAIKNGFQKVGQEPTRLRCYTRQALVDSLGDSVSLYSRTPVENDDGQDTRTATQFNIVRSETFPFWGRQEIRFFDKNLGIVISDLTIDNQFDYEFVYEELSFLQFRVTGSSAETLSPRHAPLIIDRPGLKFSMAPSGHTDMIRYFPTARWRTVTPFFDANGIQSMFGDDATTEHMLGLFKHWRSRFQNASHRLPADMLDALKSVMECPFRGQLRRTFLEAKTAELICLSISYISEQQSNANQINLRRQDKSRLDTARDILDQHYAHPPTLTELGRMVGLNRRKLAEGFKQLFNQTVYQYCLTRRMNEARGLLELGVAIAQVAENAGYADQASFSRAFRQYHGQAPGYFHSH